MIKYLWIIYSGWARDQHKSQFLGEVEGYSHLWKWKEKLHLLNANIVSGTGLRLQSHLFVTTLKLSIIIVMPSRRLWSHYLEKKYMDYKFLNLCTDYLGLD